MEYKEPRVAIIDGCRTPFLRSGTGFSDLMGWQLGQAAVKGLLARNGVPHAVVDEVVMGCVAPDISTTNIAREISLGAGLPQSIPAHTCTVACISANQAISNAACSILAGKARVAIAGGVETFSDADIRLTRKYRKFLLDLTMFKRPKTIRGKLGLLKGMSLKDFILPEKPSISEYSTGLVMGENADRLAKRLNIDRQRQDEYAVLSHRRAVEAQKSGVFHNDIVPVVQKGENAFITEDNGPRKDAGLAKLSKLKPAFDKKYGTVTAANSSFLTDGAAAVFLMAEEAAEELGLKPLGFLKDFSYTAMDPLEELLLGPAFAIGDLMKKNAMDLSEIGVFEIHEAFAAQMLANIDCLSSSDFGREKIGMAGAVGDIAMEKLNVHGGSLSIGHPFGATGARLLTTCCRRMREEGERYGILAACAAGAVGNAMLIENPEAA